MKCFQAAALAAGLSGLPVFTFQTATAAERMETPVNFRVTESGAASFSIPIEVPPGTAGMNPVLSLNYSSQGGDGLLGVGWSLGGLSAIYRCGRTLIQDGIKDTVNYNADDRYCLDGQRLVAVSGAYGANNTEYRTERESHTKIISYGAAGSGPAYFKAWTKSGQIVEFGNSNNSRIEAQGKTDVRIWAANKISDAVGNYLTVIYIEDYYYSGHYWPHRIDYTGNANAGLAPYNSVRFVYQSRPDITPLYQAGSVIEFMARLVNLQTYAKVNNVDTLVKSYRLVYDQSPSTQRSRITSITECDGGAPANCLNAINFTLSSNGTGTFSDGPTFTANDWYKDPYGNYWGHGDFNGDGKTDMIYRAGYSPITGRIKFSNGDGTFTDGPAFILGTWILSYGDFNGDGKADILESWNDMVATKLIRFSNGDGTFTDGPTFTTSDWYLQRWDHGDFNGDGKTDIVYQASTVGVRIKFSNGDGTFTDRPGIDTGVWDKYSYTNYGDFNGDGKTDIIYQAGYPEATKRIKFSKGDGTFTDGPAFTAGNVYSLDPRYWSYRDFNGDGKTDIVYHASTPANRKVILFSKGDGTFSGGTGFTTSDAVDPTSPSWNYGDFNGDGKADINYWVSTTSNNYMRRIKFSNGDGTFTDGPIFVTMDNNVTVSEWLQSSRDCQDCPYGDFNGDGKTDIVYRLNSAANTGVIKFSGVLDGSTDLAVAVTNSLGAVTNITYKPITNNSIYTKDTGAVYPYVDIQAPLYVVSSATVSDGVGGTRSTDYQYFGAKSHQTGGGFLGFRQFDATDAATGINTSTAFRQDYPYQGLPTTVTQTQANGSVLHSVANIWSFDTYADTVQPIATATGSKHHFPKIGASQEKIYELNGSLVTQVDTATQFDTYGNAVQVTINTNDGYSKTTTNNYINDPVKWFLGRLTRSTVQSTVP